MPCRSLHWEPIGSCTRSCKRRAIAPKSLDESLGRRAGAVTREPEDLPAIASLFRWTGQSNGTVNRAVTRFVRTVWEIVR